MKEEQIKNAIQLMTDRYCDYVNLCCDNNKVLKVWESNIIHELFGMHRMAIEMCSDESDVKLLDSVYNDIMKIISDGCTNLLDLITTIATQDVYINRDECLELILYVNKLSNYLKECLE